MQYGLTRRNIRGQRKIKLLTTYVAMNKDCVYSKIFYPVTALSIKLSLIQLGEMHWGKWKLKVLSQQQFLKDLVSRLFQRVCRWICPDYVETASKAKYMCIHVEMTGTAFKAAIPKLPTDAAVSPFQRGEFHFPQGVSHRVALSTLHSPTINLCMLECLSFLAHPRWTIGFDC